MDENCRGTLDDCIVAIKGEFDIDISFTKMDDGSISVGYKDGGIEKMGDAIEFIQSWVFVEKV